MKIVKIEDHQFLATMGKGKQMSLAKYNPFKKINKEIRQGIKWYSSEEHSEPTSFLLTSAKVYIGTACYTSKLWRSKEVTMVSHSQAENYNRSIGGPPRQCFCSGRLDGPFWAAGHIIVWCPLLVYGCHMPDSGFSYIQDCSLFSSSKAILRVFADLKSSESDTRNGTLPATHILFFFCPTITKWAVQVFKIIQKLVKPVHQRPKWEA